ncbi:hypothetical protein ABG067_002212 [Albugo candida]
MKLDVSALRYLTKEHFRVLTSIEMGMKNHEIVPVDLIASIAKLRAGGIQKILSQLLRHRLIAHDGDSYEGFRLTYNGYDFLALRVFLERNHVTGLGRQIGVGKESDIYIATQEDGQEVAIKFHRLGRTSFRAVKNKRDYLKKRNSTNWFYMSRLSALKEFTFLKALHSRGFPTPTPIDYNRHAICMSLVHGYTLNQVRHIANSEDVYDFAMSLIVRLAECGLVHCDLNEFNLMINEEGELTMIDFPQMISISHPNATEMFDRDVRGLIKFFAKLSCSFVAADVPKLDDITTSAQDRLDLTVEASGFGGEHGLPAKVDLGEMLDPVEFADRKSCEESADAICESNIKEANTNSQFIPATDFEDIGLNIERSSSEIRQATIRSIVTKNLSNRKPARKSTRNQAKLNVKGRVMHRCDNDMD